MGDPLRKSKKRSDGNPAPSPDEDFVLFLDENLHKCVPLLEVIRNASVRHELHGAHFSQGELDTVWLPYVCKKGWVILTKDKGIRYNQLEIAAIIANKGKEFFFTSGNWSGGQMAEILSKALNRIKRFVRKNDAPFLASITSAGEVHLRYDKDGPVHEQTRKLIAGND